MITQKDADKVNKKLNDTNFWENGSYGDIYEEDGFLHIDDVDGDWKHTHAYLDYLMKEMGYEVVEERTKNEDPDVIDDWYLSDHIYKEVEK